MLLFQAPQEFRRKVQEACTIMSNESGQALKELSLAIRTMTKPSSPNPHIENSKIASQKLKSLLKSDSWEDINLLQVIPVAAVASLLTDIVICVEDIAESVIELASVAKFKSPDLNVTKCKMPSDEGITKQLQMNDCPHAIVSINLTPPPTDQEHQSQFQESVQDTRQNAKV